MKMLLLFSTVLLMIVQSFSQPITNTTLSKDYYIKKSKNQKTTGWVLLIGGGLLGAIGLTKATQIANDPDIGFTEGFNSSIGWAVAGATGCTLAVCSIPLFLSAKRSARKAATISYNHKRILIPHPNSIVLKSEPTLTMNIAF